MAICEHEWDEGPGYREKCPDCLEKLKTVMWERHDGMIIYIQEGSNSRNMSDEKLCDGTWKRLGVCE